MQHSSIETEHWYLFEKLVVAHSQRFATNKINFVGYQNTLATRILKLKFSEGFTRTWTLSLALASWRKIKTVSSWSRELLFALRVSSSQTPPKLSCWWIGISSYEVPTESGKLDFAFAVRGKRAEGHYYLLPSEPTSVQKAWLSQNKVYWGLAHFPQSNLDFINRLKFILKSLE
ncbi:MAG: hypothetical protein IT289_12825, partial [Oligoflexia bacterium]|nr:hypothetical protein [Oligoflexia bacterium]